MFQHYNVVLVVLSYAISVFGSFTGLTLAAKIPEASGSRRTALMVGAAISLGGAAIWAMHFVAMLAYDSSLDIQPGTGLLMRCNRTGLLRKK
jgi:NO-binding membrane sensor protein with MHYT domain